MVRRAWLTSFQAAQIRDGKQDQLLLGPYVLLDKLGEGGMGQVFKARHRRLGRVDAIKLIRQVHLSNPDASKRFYREIRAASALAHANIVHAYDADEVDGVHYFAMEYVDGMDLREVLKQRGPLPVAEACDYVRQAALGLQHAYERGLVHRDVKPHNLLVTAGTPTVKILDLGLARFSHAAEQGVSSTMTGDGTVMGTPDYIAPEQALSSHAVDIRADVYSLGCTLYHLLTGSVPFPNGTAMEKLLAHQLTQPATVRELRPGVSHAVEQVVARAMAKKPEERFQTPAEMARALTEALQQGGNSDSDPAPAWDFGMTTTPLSGNGATMAQAQHLRRQRGARERHLFWVLAVAAILLSTLLVGMAIMVHNAGRRSEMTDDLPSPDTRSTRPARQTPPAPPPAEAARDEHALSPGALTAAEAKKQQEDEAKRFGVPVEMSNSVGMRLRLIPPGRFLMGSPESEPGRSSDELSEGPQHAVRITKPFFIGAFEVTQAEYEKVTGADNPSHFNQEKGGGPNHPVDSVSWSDSMKFCKLLSQLPAERQARRTYRLPTEAEWEYACRAGTTTAYAFGPNLDETQANFGRGSKGPTTPVGDYPPNAWGLHDMHGNVWEWCLDPPRAYRETAVTDPVGSDEPSVRTPRGGSFYDGPYSLRSAHRQAGNTGDVRQFNSGFRVICEIMP